MFSTYGWVLYVTVALIFVSLVYNYFISRKNRALTKKEVRRLKAVPFLEKLQSEKFITFLVQYKQLQDTPFFMVRRSDTKVEVLKKRVDATYNYFQLELDDFLNLAKSRGSVSTYLMLNQVLAILQKQNCVEHYNDTQSDVQSILLEKNVTIF